ncbi:TVP38/TMEM64 family protein [Neobacillus dielmonensis]|uniref:TVP38/TMEM64 family protein n=1 Tax=Neobacillus dielmonensis TaxID=1347369 RepID=UPI0005A7B580|nr:TVP38/TMEM64 family protein [Neobacillus dielmonensis]
MVNRAISLSILAIIILIVYTMKDSLFHVLNEGGILSIWISILMTAISVFFPIIPFPLLAGTIGALHGFVQGALFSWFGVMTGTMMFFFLSRYGFREYAQNKLKKFDKLNKYARLIEQHTFIAVLAFRLIPVIPAPVVNMVCGLSYVHWLPFFIASAIGKLPNIVILSYAGSVYHENKWLSVGLYGLYSLIILMIIVVFRYKNKTNNHH